MSYKISLSSCWLSSRHGDGYEMLKEIADMGFKWAELSHGIRLSLVPGIRKAVNEGIIKISSLHNFCPLPPGMSSPCPNLYQPTSPKKAEINNWYKNTINTLEFANEMNVDRVIIHLGSLRFLFFDPTRKLERYMKRQSLASLQNHPKFQSLLSETYFKIKKKSVEPMQRLFKSISSIIPTAQRYGIKLCFENREDITELPLDQDMPDFLQLFDKTDAAGYWHDTGHGQIKQEMGIITQKQLLQNNHKKLLGFHLQNLINGKPHRPLMTGSVDFDIIKKYFKPDLTYVLELSPSVKPQDVLESRNYLIDLISQDVTSPITP